MYSCVKKKNIFSNLPLVVAVISFSCFLFPPQYRESEALQYYSLNLGPFPHRSLRVSLLLRDLLEKC